MANQTKKQTAKKQNKLHKYGETTNKQTTKNMENQTKRFTL